MPTPDLAAVSTRAFSLLGAAGQAIDDETAIQFVALADGSPEDTAARMLALASASEIRQNEQDGKTVADLQVVSAVCDRVNRRVLQVLSRVRVGRADALPEPISDRVRESTLLALQANYGLAARDLLIAAVASDLCLLVSAEVDPHDELDAIAIFDTWFELALTPEINGPVTQLPLVSTTADAITQAIQYTVGSLVRQDGTADPALWEVLTVRFMQAHRILVPGTSLAELADIVKATAANRALAPDGIAYDVFVQEVVNLSTGSLARAVQMAADGAPEEVLQDMWGTELRDLISRTAGAFLSVTLAAGSD